MKMRPFGDLLPLEEARARLLRSASPVRGVERLPLSEALGRVVAKDVRSPRNVPSHRRATWDGYAVRARETRGASAEHPVRLTVVAETFAEGRAARRIRPGETVAVATGAALPEGADAVVIFEVTEREGDLLLLHRPVSTGDRLVNPGDDFRMGARLARADATLDIPTIGGLGAAGRSAVLVYRRPVVSLLSNGNELLDVGARYKDGGTYEINNLTLGALVRSAGGDPRPKPPLPDDPARIERALRRALSESDVVVVSGGSSVGERDLLPSLFPRLGRLLFHGIAVRPGKPTLAARAGNRLLIGMPGHPTSCLTNAYWLLLPVLRKIARLPGPGWRSETVRLAEAATVPSPSLSTVVPLRIEDGRAWPTFRDSSAITSLSEANGFAVLPPNAPRPRRGSSLLVHRLDPPVVPR
jgi:molybdenum cofactor synthesis domain-containing protein